MRKYEQKQILELLETLNEANDAMKQFFSKKDHSAINQLLSDSQQFAAQISTHIEQLAGKGIETVTLLEEYCELLYQISAQMNDGAYNENACFKRLRKHIIKIENSIRTELKPDKIEVVFFPYKASMWDSLESVWIAAKSDSKCDAYVVPIPYYNKLPGGNFGQMYYEGESYPDYVPVVDWQTYNVEERRPDAIFVHSPYDAANYVTSVHPDYYNERLKNFTDLLVYIPYFVAIDDVSEHFCVCAGTLYADKIFIQSEKIRDIYIKAFNAFEKSNRCVGRFGKAKDKFIAAGSPKFDKVLNSKPEDFTVPDEWRYLIEHPNGTQKKIVLYNTTIGAILTGNEQYLKKLQHVIESFKSRDDIVLWWRPHPLNEETYNAMRPQLLQEYERVVENYKSAKIGVYDDTPDLHRAICLASCYYGDMSSLVPMFGMTGKPVIIQLQHILNKPSPEDMLVLKEICADETGDFWLLPAHISSLLKITNNNWVDMELVFVTGMNRRFYVEFSCVSRIKNYTVCLPRNNEFIIIKDNITQKDICLAIDKIYYGANKITGKFYTIERNGKLFCFSPFLKTLIEIDPVEGTLTYHDKLHRKFFNGTEERKFYSIYHDAGSSVVMIPFFHSNHIIELDLDSMEFVINAVGNGKGFSYIALVGDKYWLFSSDPASITIWDKSTGEVTETNPQALESAQLQDTYVLSLIHCGSHILLFFASGKVLRIDCETMEIMETKAFTGEDKISRVCKCGSYVYATGCIGRRLIQYNIHDEKAKEIYAPVSFAQYGRMLEHEFAIAEDRDNPKAFLIPESACCGGTFEYLSKFSSTKQNLSEYYKKAFSKIAVNCNGTSGEKIFNYVKGKTAVL